jgi:hypothetical protein
MSGYRVSNIAHNSDIYIGNMQLKKKEILNGQGCGIGVKKGLWKLHHINLTAAHSIWHPKKVGNSIQTGR